MEISNSSSDARVCAHNIRTRLSDRDLHTSSVDITFTKHTHMHSVVIAVNGRLSACTHTQIEKQMLRTHQQQLPLCVWHQATPAPPLCSERISPRSPGPQTAASDPPSKLLYSTAVLCTKSKTYGRGWLHYC